MKEEALEEEIWSAVANLIAIEEHLLETARTTQNNQYAEMSAVIRKIRQKLTEIIANLHGGVEKLHSEGFRTETGELWCSVKHLLLVKVHIFEIIQKLADMNMNDEIDKCLEISEGINRLFLRFKEQIFGGDESE